MPKYKIIVRKSKGSKSLEKLYNTTDNTDAEKIYNHWILEANNGEIIEFYTGNKLTKDQVKSGKSDMKVLKPN